MSTEWICVVEDSTDLLPGQILEIAQPIMPPHKCEHNNGVGDENEEPNGNRELVLWRSESGEVCVMDARCPHMWSHLGSEGVVQGEQLICCSHFWIFDKDGTGWKENEQGRRDPKANIATYPCEERDGKIYMQLLTGVLPT